MNPSLANHAALQELRQAVAELSLISHTAGMSYDKIARDTSESIGGGRPPGGDREPKPRVPSLALVDDDPASVKAWDEYVEELAAWRASYQRRTTDYFADELARCETEHRLVALAAEAVETLAAWRRTPIPGGQEPTYGTAQWKRYIFESTEDAGKLADRFNTTRRYINKVRQGYRDGGIVGDRERAAARKSLR